MAPRNIRLRCPHYSETFGPGHVSTSGSSVPLRPWKLSLTLSRPRELQLYLRLLPQQLQMRLLPRRQSSSGFDGAAQDWYTVEDLLGLVWPWYILIFFYNLCNLFFFLTGYLHYPCFELTVVWHIAFLTRWRAISSRRTRIWAWHLGTLGPHGSNVFAVSSLLK